MIFRETLAYFSEIIHKIQAISQNWLISRKKLVTNFVFDDRKDNPIQFNVHVIVKDLVCPTKIHKKTGLCGASIVKSAEIKFRIVLQKSEGGQDGLANNEYFKYTNVKIYVNICARKNSQKMKQGRTNTLEVANLNV